MTTPKIIRPPLERLEQIRVRRGINVNNLPKRQHELVINDAITDKPVPAREERNPTPSDQPPDPNYPDPSAGNRNASRIKLGVDIHPAIPRPDARRRPIRRDLNLSQRREVDSDAPTLTRGAGLRPMTTAFDPEFALVAEPGGDAQGAEDEYRGRYVLCGCWLYDAVGRDGFFLRGPERGGGGRVCG